MSELDRYEELKESVKDLRNKRAKLEGAVEKFEDDLKRACKELNIEYTTVEDADQEVEKLRERCEKEQVRLRKMVKIFEAKWGEHL